MMLLLLLLLLLPPPLLLQLLIIEDLTASIDKMTSEASAATAKIEDTARQ